MINEARQIIYYSEYVDEKGVIFLMKYSIVAKVWNFLFEDIQTMISDRIFYK